jgi:uncharacterized protein
MPTREDGWPQGTPCWVDAQVDDLPAARSFYSALFGWEIQDSPPEFGGYLMAMLDGKPAAGIGPKPEGQTMPSVWTTYLAADRADDVAAAVADAGGQVMMPPFDVADIGRMFVAADPTGGIFGVWQAGSHRGAGIFNTPGAYAWNELHTRDYAAAQAFYGKVFGYSFTEIGDGVNMTYSTISLPGATNPMDAVGGVADDSKQPGEMSYWLTWFASADADASVAKVTELGGSVMMAPETTPFGRMAIVTGTQGEMFGLIDLETRAEPPQG